MPSPFPGMDPYIQTHNLWRDFHARFLAALSDSISDRLPEPYVARIDERLKLVEFEEERGRPFLPDVVVERKGSGRGGAVVPGATLTLEPVTVPIKVFEEVRERALEIWHGPDRRVVTVVELLSPTNKAGAGRRDYLVKRNALLRQEVNLVELDFLLDGERMPMERPLPPGDYYALVARAERLPDCDVYAWSIRQPLPVVPIPLLPPDGDVRIELGPLLVSVYDRGRYARSIDYQTPLALPLDAEDRAWAETQGAR